jgi:hypothetical protein
MSEYTLEERLAYATQKLAVVQVAIDRAEAKHEAARQLGGGIPGFGGSGSQRAATKVRSALDSSYRAETEAQERYDYWQAKVASYTRRIAERDRVRLTQKDLIGATHVRLVGGSWHKVARLNKTTVSVETGYSWVDRYAFDKVLQARFER